MYFLAPMVVVFIGAWGLYNTTEVFPKAEYDLVVNPPATVARGDPRARSTLEAVQERLRTAVSAVGGSFAHGIFTRPGPDLGAFVMGNPLKTLIS